MTKDDWIGVDFDGTLAEYHGWQNWNMFGPPIPPMVDRVRQWRADGVQVRIVTARVFPYVYASPAFDMAFALKRRCLNTNQVFTIRDMIAAIGDWCHRNVGERLPVTCAKDYNMIELWDDRAIQVVPNTGRSLHEAHEAELTALKGKVFTP